MSCKGIAQVLKDEGYIWEFEEIDTVPAQTLRLHLKYGPNGERLITRIDRVSKPGCRVYRGYKELKPILGGMGIQILSTPKGVISDRQRPRREGRRRGAGPDPLTYRSAVGRVRIERAEPDSRTRSEREEACPMSRIGRKPVVRAGQREGLPGRLDDQRRRPQG